jgi:predicted amidohydrolase
MRVALVQQHAVADKTDNIRRGLDAMERAARDGAEVIAFAELAFELFHPNIRRSQERSVLQRRFPGR